MKASVQMSESNHMSGVLPVLPMADVEAALDYYTNTLGFVEKFRQPGPDGVILNAQVEFAGCHLMFNHNPEDAPKQGGGVYFWFRLDRGIDDHYAALEARGASVVEKIADQFWGDRSFTIVDHAGYHLAFNMTIERAS